MVWKLNLLWGRVEDDGFELNLFVVKFFNRDDYIKNGIKFKQSLLKSIELRTNQKIQSVVKTGNLSSSSPKALELEG